MSHVVFFTIFLFDAVPVSVFLSDWIRVFIVVLLDPVLSVHDMCLFSVLFCGS